MNLLLTSNGLEGKLQEIVVTLLKKPAKENKVAFITTAAYGEGEDISWLNKYKVELKEVGFTDIEDIDLRDFSEKQLEEKLSDKDILFVNGGNTFFLLHFAKKCGFDSVVRRFLADGKLYIGASAGSIICCPTIETAVYSPEDFNTVGITDLSGFSYVPFLISPHFSENSREVLEEESAEASLPLVVLTDTQAVLVEGGDIKLVGEGGQIILSGRKNPTPQL